MISTEMQNYFIVNLSLNLIHSKSANFFVRDEFLINKSSPTTLVPISNTIS